MAPKKYISMQHKTKQKADDPPMWSQDIFSFQAMGEMGQGTTFFEEGGL